MKESSALDVSKSLSAVDKRKTEEGKKFSVNFDKVLFIVNYHFGVIWRKINEYCLVASLPSHKCLSFLILCFLPSHIPSSIKQSKARLWSVKKKRKKKGEDESVDSCSMLASSHSNGSEASGSTLRYQGMRLLQHLPHRVQNPCLHLPSWCKGEVGMPSPTLTESALVKPN